MLGSEIVAEALTRIGTGHLFGLIGHTTLPVIGALVRDGRVRWVPARHEANAVMMAAGYAQTTGRTGLVSTIHGPGFTNTITALTACVRQGVPLVLFVGEAGSSDPSKAQYSDVAAGARLAGAGFHRTPVDAKLATLVAGAALAAQEEQRPQVLSIDLKQLHAEVAHPERVALPRAAAAGRVPDSEALDRAAALLRGSTRPVIVAGRGAARGLARDDLVALARDAGALLSTSLLAHGLFAGEEWSLGVAGGFSSPPAKALIAEADCVLAFGASLNAYQTADYKLFAKAQVIQCDDDPRAFDVLQRVAVALHGDAAATARALRERLGSRPAEGYRTAAVRARIDGFVAFPAGRSEGALDAIDPHAVVAHLERALPSQRTMVMAVTGPAADPVTSLLTVPDERGWVWAHGFASIGLGLGTAVGAALARPDRLTTLVSGDGSFMMSAQELDAAVQSGARLLIVLLNDRGYGTEVPQLHDLGLPVSAAKMATPDLVAVARGFGADGTVLREPRDLARLPEIVRGVRGTFLVDARTVTLGMPAD